MTFPVHRSDEPTRARARRGVRARAGARGRSTRSRSTERMFAETGVDAPGTSASRTGRTRRSPAIAAGAGVRARRLLRRQRPHRDPGRRGADRVLGRRRRRPAGAELGLAPGPGGLDASIWIVEHDHGWFVDADRGRHPGQDRAQRRRPRRLPEPPAHDAPTAATTARRSTSCCARCSRRCRTVDEAIELLTHAKVSASSAVTVADARRRRVASSSHPAARTSSAARVGAHTNHFLEPPQARPRHDADESAEHASAAGGRPQRSRCSTRCAPTTATRRASAATSTRASRGPSRPSPSPRS